jgi:hypothetical protein
VKPIKVKWYMMSIARNAKSIMKFLKIGKLVHRDDCKHLVKIETDFGDDLNFCRLATNMMCYEAPLTLCKKYEIVSNPKYKKQEFIEEEEMTL